MLINCMFTDADCFHWLIEQVNVFKQLVHSSTAHEHAHTCAQRQTPSNTNTPQLVNYVALTTSVRCSFDQQTRSQYVT